jgi:hypothetical protein
VEAKNGGRKDLTFYTTTTLLQGSDVSFGRGVSFKLITKQIGVVRRVDPIVRQWLSHILINLSETRVD